MLCVPVAKVVVGRAVGPVTTIAHQLHGAIGVTRVGATRTAAMLDDCRQRLGLAPLESHAAELQPAGY